MNNKDYILPAYLNIPQNHNPNFILWLVKDVYHQITIVGKMNKEKALEFAFDQFKCSDKIKELYKEKYGIN
jgi:hypothetical protein